jgi:hypothetical protein
VEQDGNGADREENNSTGETLFPLEEIDYEGEIK